MAQADDQRTNVTDDNFVLAFPSIVGLYLLHNSGDNYERNKDILTKRFGLDDESICTLDDIGTYYELTRERIRQIEASSVRRLGKLLRGEYPAGGPKLNNKLIDEYSTIKNNLRDLGFLVTNTEIDSITSAVSGYHIKSGYFELFMETSGYARIPSTLTGFRGSLSPCWCDLQQQKRNDVYHLITCLDFIFDQVDPISLFDITVTVKKTYRGELNNDAIYTVLKVCDDIEVTKNSASVKFNRLRGTTDKAYRILSTSRSPMHYTDICREINMRSSEESRKKALTRENLRNQMVTDKKFVPIGRSGRWGLSSWGNLNHMTIVEAMEETLHKAGKPLTYKQIRAGIQRLRPDASEHSIHVYLGDTKKFSRVDNTYYALEAWQIKSVMTLKAPKHVMDDDFFASVDKAFGNKKEIPNPDLIRFVKFETGLSDSSIRGRIASASHLRLENRANSRCKYLIRSHKRGNDGTRPRRQLLRNKVQEETRAVLFENPNKPFRKIELHEQVNRNVPCQRPTFYRYLSEMRDIRQYKDGINYFVAYENKEVVDKISLNLAPYNISPLLSEELKGPLSRLTMDKVDLALFELGRIFERKLKSYLQAAKVASVIRVTNGDMSRLVNMINCIVREGVVKKGYHLHTLREERNSRSHGKAPSLTERIELFNKAHYIAALFLQYIAFLEDARKDIQEKSGLSP